MPSVGVVVPWRGGCEYRERAWRWVRRGYAREHPGWQVVQAQAPAGPWCKAAAVMPVIRALSAEVIVAADADVSCDGIAEAVEAVRAGAGWAIPHRLLHRLSEPATAAVLSGERWQDQELDERPYPGIQGGGIVVAHRETLLAVPMDPRFIGWGQEDECHAMALHTILGPAWRGEAPLVHLFHPPQPRISRRWGSQDGRRLRRRYSLATEDPIAMCALLKEALDALQPAEPAVPDRAAV